MSSGIPPHSVGAEGGGAGGGGGGAEAPAQSGASGHALLWNKTQQLPEELFRQLHSIYGEHFPLEARHHLAGNFFPRKVFLTLKIPFVEGLILYGNTHLLQKKKETVQYFLIFIELICAILLWSGK